MCGWIVSCSSFSKHQQHLSWRQNIDCLHSEMFKGFPMWFSKMPLKCQPPSNFQNHALFLSRWNPNLSQRSLVIILCRSKHSWANQEFLFTLEFLKLISFNYNIFSNQVEWDLRKRVCKKNQLCWIHMKPLQFKNPATCLFSLLCTQQNIGDGFLLWQILAIQTCFGNQ